MSQFAEFILGDGVIVSCPLPEGKTLETGSVYVLEIDGVMEFGRFMRLCGCHSPCHSYLLGQFVQVAGEMELTKLSGNSEAVQRARTVLLKWAADNKKLIEVVRMRFSVRRERLTMLVHAADFVNLSPVNEILEKRFQTKVVSRVTSPREIAGAIGGVGVCGGVLCCNSGICVRSSVDMRMAKQQAVPLHDAAATGVCGKLKCCIGYETEASASSMSSAAAEKQEGKAK